MYYIEIADAAIGQIISEPVFSASGVLLCNPGTPVSNSLKAALKRFEIKEIPVEPIVGETFDNKYLNFDSLDNMTMLSIRRLDVSGITKCANSLVDSLAKNTNSAMLHTLFEYDKNTGQHSMNVATLAITCGIKIGLSVRDLYLLALGSLLHDIGKLMIPVEVLNKPGKLTDEEFNLIKRHPEFGIELLKKSEADVPQAVIEIILQHHENHDGTGYPRQLSDFHIYKLARLVHIADVYEALCRKRPYKDAYPRDLVREFMLEESGVKLDPIMLKKFLDAIPMYLAGEEIEGNGLVGVVVDTTDGNDPLISVGRDIVRLSNFRNAKWTKKKVFSDFSELVFR